MQCQSSHKPAYMLFYFADYFMHQAMMQAFPHVKRTEVIPQAVHEYRHGGQFFVLIKNCYKPNHHMLRVIAQQASLARMNLNSDAGMTKLSIEVDKQQVDVYITLTSWRCGTKSSIEINTGGMSPRILEAVISTLAHALWQV